MKKKQLYFIGAAVAIFVFFNWLIPVHIIYDNEFIWGIVAAVCVGLCLYFGLKPEESEMYTPENYEAGKAKSRVAGIVVAIAAIATIFCVYFLNIPREDQYIKKNSVVTKGTVMDGRAKTTKRRGTSSTTYTLDVQFDVNGKVYKESISVDGSDWSDAGKGMPVLVAYAKDHPKMCKILFSGDLVEKYTSGTQIRKLKLDEFVAAFRNREQDLTPQLDKVSLGWGQQESEKGTRFYYHSVFKTAVVSNDDMMYMLETGQSNNYSALLAEAQKTMKPEYDSMTTNPKLGAVYQKDSLRIRFQQYTAMVSGESGGEFNFPMIKSERRYIAAITTRKGDIFLPGDLEEDASDPAQRMKLLQEKAKEMLENKKYE